MIGGACGELAAHLAHASTEQQALWALVGMGAMLSGSLGVPLTAILFSLEITHSLPALLPLMLGCVSAYAVTSLIMPRSILTEKLSRRGYHLTREYGTDPLETVSVLEIMTEAESPLPDTPHPPRRLRLHRRDLPRRRRKNGRRRTQLPPRRRPPHQRHPRHHHPQRPAPWPPAIHSARNRPPPSLLRQPLTIAVHSRRILAGCILGAINPASFSQIVLLRHLE